MGKHKLFGGIAADSFSVGDIVQWSSWNMQKQNWDENYGIITDISSVFKSNRLVSVSKDIEQTFSAKAIMDLISSNTNLKGGGKNDFAQAGGDAIDNLESIYDLVTTYLENS